VHKIIDFDYTESEKEMGDNDVLIYPQSSPFTKKNTARLFHPMK